MKEFNSIEEILEFAMEEEQKAVDFYTGLAGSSKTEDMQKIFIEFAKEEMGHKARLKTILEEGQFSVEQENITDLHISDFLVSIEPTPNMTYEEALVVAMKKEKSAFRLYTALMERAQNPELKNIFHSLAQEEAKHKLRFEVEYDEYVLKDN